MQRDGGVTFSSRRLFFARYSFQHKIQTTDDEIARLHCDGIAPGLAVPMTNVSIIL